MTTYQFKIVPFQQEWENYAELWEELFIQCQSFHSFVSPFYHPIFLSATMYLPKAEQPSHIVIGYYENELIFGLPVIRIRHFSTFPILQIWGAQGFDYLAPLDATPDNQATNYFLSKGMPNLNVYLVHGEHISKSFVDIICSNKNSWSEQVFRCPYLTLPNNITEFLYLLSSNFRKKIRQNIKKAEEKNIHFRVRTTSNGEKELENSLEKLIYLHIKRSSQVDRRSKFSSESRSEYFLQVCMKAEKWPSVVHFFELFSDDETIASLFGFLIGDRFLFFQHGFLAEYGDLSPGNFLIYRTICYLIEIGAREFDFLRGADTYKFRWTSTWRETMRFAYGQGSIGGLLTQQFRIKRAMKRYGRFAGFRKWFKNED